jgi:hypothetical protein
MRYILIAKDDAVGVLKIAHHSNCCQNDKESEQKAIKGKKDNFYLYKKNKQID